MNQSQQVQSKVFTKTNLEKHLNIWRLLGKKIAFTNGVFDIIHKGHLSLLSEAAGTADILIVAVNADSSVKRLKGNSRPINDEFTRTLLLASLLIVDCVIIFEEDTPLELIKMIKPDVLIKGGDYTQETIVGADIVTENGGEIRIIPLSEGYSTTNTINSILKDRSSKF